LDQIATYRPPRKYPNRLAAFKTAEVKLDPFHETGAGVGLEVEVGVGLGVEFGFEDGDGIGVGVNF